MNRVIRALGSNRVHTADLPPALIGRWAFLGTQFTGAAGPIVTSCGACLRDVVVCMKEGTRVSCSRCLRLTGIEAAGPDNAWDTRVTRVVTPEFPPEGSDGA